MLSREQLESDIEFLARRAKRTGGWYAEARRDWGISSNSLVSYAYGVGVHVAERSAREDHATARAAGRWLRSWFI